MKNKKLGLAITGSFCTLKQILPIVKQIVEEGNIVVPILSYSVSQIDTRFYKAKDFKRDLEDICKMEAITTIDKAEPIGPNKDIDLMIVAPCTGNTLSKLNHAITDTPVLMAVKAHLRNNKPVLVAVSSNDAMSSNFKNLGELMNKKNFFFVPFFQDDFKEKPNSLIADYNLLYKSAEYAANSIQIQPIIRG